MAKTGPEGRPGTTVGKLAGIEDLRWIRFLYAYPNKITGRLLQTIASHEKICSYMDVPLQHASASALKRMKRGGGAEIFLRSIEKMRRVIPEVTLRTSFIVGFPAKRRKNSRSCAILCARPNLIGWVLSPTPIRTALRLTILTIRSRRRKLSADAST